MLDKHALCFHIGNCPSPLAAHAPDVDAMIVLALFENLPRHFPLQVDFRACRLRTVTEVARRHVRSLKREADPPTNLKRSQLPFSCVHTPSSFLSRQARLMRRRASNSVCASSANRLVCRKHDRKAHRIGMGENHARTTDRELERTFCASFLAYPTIS